MAQMFIENFYFPTKDVIRIVRQSADPIEGIEGGDEYLFICTGVMQSKIG